MGGGKPAARQGDMTRKGLDIVQGSAGVLIGAPTGVACSVCPTKKDSPNYGSPVNPLLGAKVLPVETDLALPGPLPFILFRAYSSYRTRTPAPVGVFGPGWKAPFDIRLQVHERELILNDSGGRSIHFESLFPGEISYSRSESFWLARGGVLKQHKGHPLARLWRALPEAVRLSPHTYMMAVSTTGQWLILGWPERVPEADEVPPPEPPAYRVLAVMLGRLERELRAGAVSAESEAWLAQCGLMAEQMAAQMEAEYIPERKLHLYHCDHRGLPQALISPEGETAWCGEYDEWGNLLGETSAQHLQQSLRLPGQQYDEESGLYYNRNRYYDPLQGRYITQDPIGLKGGWNLYAYPLNPVQRGDPLGLSGETLVLGSATTVTGTKFGGALLSGGAATFDAVTTAMASAAPALGAMAVVAGPMGYDLLANDGRAGKALSDGQLINSQAEMCYWTSSCPLDSPHENDNSSGSQPNVGKDLTDEEKNCLAGGSTGSPGGWGPEDENSARDRMQHERYKDELRQKMGKPDVTDSNLKNIIDDLYRPNAKVGSGSTADAVRYELATGEKVGGRGHVLKAQDYTRALQDWLDKNPTASPGDRAAAENVLQDLQNALGGK
ncbi:RHS repeat-associated core domain-containing protein [Escherichia coli]|uniref:RHS repeat-associated core domain-containing protein n=1 Tax=Escherichia coli TaxID=562 RepID=UPI0039F72FC0